jgi:DNA-binding Xre family transcriptional regulator
MPSNQYFVMMAQREINEEELSERDGERTK